MHLIDTHFHLDYYKNHEYWYDQINKLQQYTLCVTNSPEVFHSCRKLYPETKYVKFALGYNPQQSLKVDFSKSTFLHELSTTQYVGEVGLDYSKNFVASKKKQQDAFEFICHQAAKQNKLLSVHSRMAEEDTLKILLRQGVKKAIIHWYTGNLKIMNHLLDAGYYFSVNSSMCDSVNGRKIISNIPIDRLLVESDGPFSKIGTKKYSPADLQQTYNLISNTIGSKEISKLVFNNFKYLLSQHL